MSREKIVYVQAAVRGFHFYKSIWIPEEAEVLSCEYEEKNPYDIFAIKTCQENGRIVGHLPMEISRITKYLIDRGARIDAKLSETHYRRSPLVQGGLEIPCTLIIRMPGTVKSNELIKKYLELFEARYEEPQEVIVLGTFKANLNNEPNQTARCNSSNNSAKKSKKSVAHGSATKSYSKSKDIRAMFAKIARKDVEKRNGQQKDNETSVIVIE